MHWIQFNEWCARHSVRGQIRRHNGLQAAWSHTSLLINNLTTPLGPVSRQELVRLARSAVEDAAPHRLPWMFGIPEPWLDVSLEDANSEFAAVGLQHLMDMTVMETNGAVLHPPRHPMPIDTEICRVDLPARAFDAIDLNSRAYGMPRLMTEDVLASNTYFSDPAKEFGVVVYHHGAPVSTATAIDLGDWVYIAAVATDPDHRQKGYAEAAMRAVIAAAPAKQVALDASRMGEPLYAQMGFARRFKWNFWIPAASA